MCNGKRSRVFRLSAAESISSGLSYGTEYDVWVRDLGRENFEDPTDPSTATGGGVKGLNLSFFPEDSAAVWSNYKSTDGPMKGFEFGLGVTYRGPAQTSVGIGGSDLVQNLYGTPDSKEIYQLNGAITYKHRFEAFDLRLSLNLYNLLDESYYESRTAYENVVTGEDENRRYYFYVEPRRFRLTATLIF